LKPTRHASLFSIPMVGYDRVYFRRQVIPKSLNEAEAQDDHNRRV
jgi:hypothetical protein